MHPTRSLLWLLLLSSPLIAQPSLPTEPPAIYRRAIAPLLTPLEKIPPTPADCLLREEIYWLAPEGMLYHAEHQIVRAAAPSPSFSLAPRSPAQKAYLALTRSQEGGQPWKDGSAAARADADGTNLTFPGLGAGGLAEWVVLSEEPLPIAGEWTALLTFYGEKPTALARVIAELPTALAARLQSTPVGAAPPQQSIALKDGRTRLEWSLARPPAGRNAALWLTTLDSWDRLADWYREKLPQGVPPAELLAAARAATSGAGEPRALIQSLLRQLVAWRGREPAGSPAASLGLGESLAFAQLLRALLADQGLVANLALVNSRGAGAIDARSPDSRHFDRALLAIEIPGEKGRSSYLWIDPARPELEPGQLGPGAGERQAFLLPAGGGWRFATTPPALAAPPPAAAPASPPRAEVEPAKVADEFGAAASADALVEKSLLALEAGREEDAWAALLALRQLDPAALARSSSPQQARGLRQLTENDQLARRAWASSAIWWPSWLELEKAAGLPPAEAPPALLLGDLVALGQRFGSLLAQRDPAAWTILRQLAHAGRWDPQMALELSGSLIYLVARRPELAKVVHETAIVLHRSLPPFADPEAAARSRLLLAAHLVDSGRPAEARDPLRDLLALEVGGVLQQRGAALLAIVALATGEGREQAATTLAGALDATFPAELRPAAVRDLAELYHRLGRLADERQLLEAELSQPAIAASQLAGELAARLAASRAGSDLFATTFAAWRARFELPLLEIAEPATLADPRLAGLATSELLGPSWLPAEKVKIAFLAAVDAGRPEGERVELVATALRLLGDLLPRQSFYRQLLGALVEEPLFPPSLRSAAAFWLGANQCRHSELGALDALLARPDSQLYPRQRAVLGSWRELILLQSAGPAAIEPYAAARLEHPLDELATMNFPQLWQLVMFETAPGFAEQLAGRLDQLKTVSDAAAADSLRQDARRQLAESRELRASRDVLRRLLLSGPAGELPPKRPAAAAEIGNPAALESVSPEACRQLLLFDLATRQLGAAGSSAWPSLFLGCQEQNEAAGPFARDFVFAVFDSLSSDALRAETLASTTAAIADDEPIWPELLAGLSRRIDPAKEPQSHQVLRLLELRQALRRGENIDFAAAGRGLEGWPLRRLQYWQERILLRDGDARAARAYLEPLPASALENPAGLPERLRLVGLYGSEQQRRRLAEVARRQLYLLRLRALELGSWSAGREAIRLAAALGNAELYSREWLAALLESVHNELGRVVLQLADAEARADWPAAYTSAERLIELEGPDFDELWNLGRAAFYAGKKEAAQVALRRFLEKAGDHPDRLEARLLLARLEEPQPTAAPGG